MGIVKGRAIKGLWRATAQTGLLRGLFYNKASDRASKHIMKKIIMSLAMIAAAGALVVGATTAYFSDVEESTGNTFTAGTIDIAVDESNPWQEPFTIDDFKPCRDVVQTMEITNVGENPADIYKQILNWNSDNNGWTEPECDEEGGDFNQGDRSCTVDSTQDNLLDVITYDLYVEVYESSDKVNRLWWQTFYTGDENKTISDVYGNDTQIKLGMLPKDAVMVVEQSYHFNCDAGNKYQSDRTTFDMRIEAKQLDAPLVEGGEGGYASTELVEKTRGDNDEWIIDPNGVSATLQYKLSGEEFEFMLNGQAPLANEEYTLVVGEDPWEYPGDACELADVSSDGSNNVNITATSEECNMDMNSYKAWLVLSSDWTGADPWNGWNEGDYLFETALVNYEDTNN